MAVSHFLNLHFPDDVGCVASFHVLTCICVSFGEVYSILFLITFLPNGHILFKDTFLTTTYGDLGYTFCPGASEFLFVLRSPTWQVSTWQLPSCLPAGDLASVLTENQGCQESTVSMFSPASYELTSTCIIGSFLLPSVSGEQFFLFKDNPLAWFSTLSSQDIAYLDFSFFLPSGSFL